MSSNDTNQGFQFIISHCLQLFEKKMSDYGTAWRVLRVSSLTDQIFIKARRIRSIQLKSVKMVDEEVDNEFVGIINYAAMAIIQLRRGVAEHADLPHREAAEALESVLQEAFALMNRKITITMKHGGACA